MLAYAERDYSCTTSSSTLESEYTADQVKSYFKTLSFEPICGTFLVAKL